MVYKIRELINQLNNYTDLYNKEKSPISDNEWDKLYFELQELEKKSGVIYPDSPTQEVRYEVKNELQKVEHNHEMLSLAKCHTEQEIESFIEGHDWIAMLKLDGLTCSLRYVNGHLVSAETRGDGLVGEDITHNAKIVKNIPQTINFKDELIVDGEIIINQKVFNEKFAADYKNPRNLASGSIRLLDSRECAERELEFIAWDCIKGMDDYALLSDRLFFLEVFGFKSVPFTTDAHMSISSILENLCGVSKTTGYPIDGIVFKYNNCDYYNSLGTTSHHPLGGIAYKFLDEVYETELQDIEWTMGRTGILTPVAIFENVNTSKSIINRASLHNLSILKSILGEKPWVGQKIKVILANDIIPQVIWGEREISYGKKS